MPQLVPLVQQVNQLAVGCIASVNHHPFRVSIRYDGGAHAVDVNQSITKSPGKGCHLMLNRR